MDLHRGKKFDSNPAVKNKLLHLFDKLRAIEDHLETEQEFGAFDDPELARHGTLKEVHLDIKNPFIKDFEGESFRDESYRDLIKQAKKDGHDGVIFKNTYDAATQSGDEESNIYVVFKAHQILDK